MPFLLESFDGAPEASNGAGLTVASVTNSNIVINQLLSVTNWTEEQALVSHRPRAAHLLAVRVPTFSVVTTANFFPAPMSMQQWDFEGSTPALFRALKPAFRFLRAVLVPAAHMTFNDNDNDERQVQKLAVSFNHSDVIDDNSNDDDIDLN